MKRLFPFLFTFLFLCLTGCSAAAETGYTQIDQDTAKEMPCTICWKMVNGKDEVKLLWNT